ncbi:hypothetical protein HZS_4806, partial [Henneguya salminicola]
MSQLIENSDTDKSIHVLDSTYSPINDKFIRLEVSESIDVSSFSTRDSHIFNNSREDIAMNNFLSPPAHARTTSKSDYYNNIPSNQFNHICLIENSYDDSNVSGYNKIPSGVRLPIDDNEFAVLRSNGSNQEISYDIFSALPSDTESERLSNNSNMLRPPTYTRTSSVNTSHSACVSTEHSRPQSLRYSVEIDGEHPKYTRELANHISANNGLFIKMNHPIFCHTFSRKVFIGGLPRDISIENIEKQFLSFGSHYVDWPNRENENIPPNGFAFLHFDYISSVEKLHEAVSNGKIRNKYTISSQSIKSKDVEVKFWKMKDCEYISEEKSLINPSYTVFVGALPRTTTASELASFMERVFTNVVYTAIDVDLLYGTKTAYQRALDSHYIDMDLVNNNKKKKIEIKPFLLIEQKCDICPLHRTNQQASKFCSRCACFLCESCELNQRCVNGKSHSLI